MSLSLSLEKETNMDDEVYNIPENNNNNNSISISNNNNNIEINTCINCDKEFSSQDLDQTKNRLNLFCLPCNIEHDEEVNILEKLGSEEFHHELNKWCGCIFKGKTLTDQKVIDEIAIRTTGFDALFTNDKNIKDKLKNILGNYDKDQKILNEKYNIVTNLKLFKNRLIVSTCPFPDSWLNWNGEINTHYNIGGQHPDTVKVIQEWRLLAKTFPELEMKCWLYNKEINTITHSDIPILLLTMKNGQYNYIINNIYQMDIQEIKNEVINIILKENKDAKEANSDYWNKMRQLQKTEARMDLDQLSNILNSIV